MPNPFHVETDELRSHAEIVRNAASTSGENQARVRALTATAAPGYPGDAAPAFEAMLRKFEKFDASIEERGYGTADRLDDSADRYDRAEDLIKAAFDKISELQN